MTRRQRRGEALIREAYRLDDITSRMLREGFSDIERDTVTNAARMLHKLGRQIGDESLYGRG